ncbi:MAG: hypothetical protein M9942_04160 [Microthrixaceae bacterium]|nr:hypothetical protein [Microthrixaceae bacterium]MCO5317613.1 hypothetical protein [Microthrixaceae bacterium]
MSEQQSPPVSGVEPQRVAEFREEIGRIGLKGAGASAERWMLIVGTSLVVVGVVLGVMGAVQTINAGDSPADQRAFTASGVLLGIVLTVAGAALFIRYSMGRFMRFWLIRLVYENRAETDRIVDAIERASGLPPSTGIPTQAVPGAGSPDLPSPPPHS